MRSPREVHHPDASPVWTIVPVLQALSYRKVLIRKAAASGDSGEPVNPNELGAWWGPLGTFVSSVLVAATLYLSLSTYQL